MKWHDFSHAVLLIEGKKEKVGQVHKIVLW